MQATVACCSITEAPLPAVEKGKKERGWRDFDRSCGARLVWVCANIVFSSAECAYTADQSCFCGRRHLICSSASFSVENLVRAAVRSQPGQRPTEEWESSHMYMKVEASAWRTVFTSLQAVRGWCYCTPPSTINNCAEAVCTIVEDHKVIWKWSHRVMIFLRIVPANTPDLSLNVRIF